MKYLVIRANTTIRVSGKAYKTGEMFEAKKESVKTLLENKYIKEIKDGKSINS